MTSAKAERQRRYIARIKADPQKREEFLMKDRLRKKNMVMTRHETRHDFRKEPEMLNIQLKNKSDAEFLNQALAYRGYKQIEKPADAIAQFSLNRKISEFFHDESISDNLKAELYWIVLRYYNNKQSKISDIDKDESNHLGPALPPSTQSPLLSASAVPKRRRYWRRVWLQPIVPVTESKRQRRRRVSAAKHNTIKPISWKTY